MCGIIGYVGFQEPKGILLDGLKRLEYRGYDSAGVAIWNKGQVEVHRCEGRIQGLEQKLTKNHFEGLIGMGHTRWATHGAPTETNAHPHQVGNITLVHNGIIENYLELKEELLAMGRTFKSETDSEIVSHLFDVEITKGKKLAEALLTVLPRLRGSYAFVIMNKQEPDVLVGVRNGVPLLVGVGQGENFVASDVQAVLHRTNQIIYLHDHEFVIARKDGVAIHGEKGEARKPEIKAIHWTPDQLEKSGYRHYMLKEIHEQAAAITHTIDPHLHHGEGTIEIQGLTITKEQLKATKRIAIVACGTARHAGLVGKYLIERIAGIPVDVDFGSEFRYRNPILDKETLLITISQSGETADTLAGLREGSQRGIRTLSICNVRESTLTRESESVLYTNAGPEIGVASTKAFTTQITALYLLAVELGTLNGSLNEAQTKELTNDLVKLPLWIEKTLESEAKLEQIALELGSSTFFFFLGRDINYPIALEGALKLKEISYAHAEGYPAGELKHGPIALIDRNTAIIVLAPKDKAYAFDKKREWASTSETIYEKIMSNLQEVKSRGGKIFSIGSESDTRLAAQSHHFVAIPDAPWSLNPILLSLPMQLLAYYTALHAGTDVDKPRNLAKSVTVE